MTKERGVSIGRKIITGISITSSIISILFFIFIFLFFIGLFIGPQVVQSGNIAVIPIKGVITTDGGSTPFGMDTTSSTRIVKWIKQADENPSVKAILFEINSPGGTPVASNEIVQAIKKTNKPTMAVIRELGASGAYWSATATDTIVANELSVTGSIGVIASYLEFSGLLKDYNITYQRLVSGRLKDTGTPFKELTFEERNVRQAQLDIVYDVFVRDVAKNRNLSEARVRELATGQIYLGLEAKKLGLIDELGTREDAIEMLEKQLGIEAELIEYKAPSSIFGSLTKISEDFSFSMGEGFANRILKEDKSYFSLE